MTIVFYTIPFISYVVSVSIPTPASIIFCKARSYAFIPPIEPMSALIQTNRNLYLPSHFNKIYLIWIGVLGV